MNLNKKINPYNTIAIASSLIYLLVLGFFFISILYANSATHHDPFDGLGIWILMLIFIPLSSLVFGILVAFLSVEPRLKVNLSYIVFAVFAILYIFSRFILPAITFPFGQIGLGGIDYIFWVCGLMLLVPAMIGYRGLKKLK